MTATMLPSVALVEVAKQRRAARAAVRSLAEFTRYIWPIIEPGTPLIWNWHLDVLAEELEMVSDGRTKELVICIPPGCMKSIMVSVAWPTWEWLKQPHLRSMNLSNSDDLVKRDMLRCRDIMRSEEFALARKIAVEEYGAPDWDFSTDQNEKHLFHNTEHGFMQAMPIGANVTGKRADRQRIDDPLDAKDAITGSVDQVGARMDEIVRIYDQALASRLNDVVNNPRVVIAQRLHPRDLPGVLIARGVRSVVLPMEFEPEHPHRHAKDPRKTKGELLFPQRFPQSWVDSEKLKPDSARWWGAQYQQLPKQDTGTMFKRDYFRYFRELAQHYEVCGEAPRKILKSDCWRFIVADTAMTEKTRADYTVRQVWDVERVLRFDGSWSGGAMFLLDQWRVQKETPEVEAEFRNSLARWNPIFIGLESINDGRTILQRFQRDGLPVRRIQYGETWAIPDKVSKAGLAQIWMAAGKVHFLAGASYLHELEGELLSFPNGVNDDQVDTLAMGCHFSNSRDLWTAKPANEYAAGSLGDMLGHKQVWEASNV